MDIMEIGDLMTIAAFEEGVACNCLIDYDGYGYWYTDGKADRSKRIWPSDYKPIPEGVTHILWFNR